MVVKVIVSHGTPPENHIHGHGHDSHGEFSTQSARFLYYCMSQKSCPILFSKVLYEMGPDVLDK